MRILGLGIPELVCMIIPLILSVVFGVVCMNLAKKKGYSEAGFFCLGFFLNIIGLIVALCVSDKNAEKKSAAL